MTVTDRPAVPPMDGDFDWRGVWTVRQELTEEKRETLADLPPITDCALALL
ncbi:hypothetical protein JCM4814A_01180 [Streptomyces phaeofaciens JCM 4814]|uniref:Uncharacterized protein n=1 Tax=Streptomyces phaeofaciens TaxID=68254 RepID=A0A918HPR1_9ACTN|nr:hypothetical protein GCM10010226_82400 [Streptomyces phaeofaciens]